jgi:hypothetical protein
MSEYAEDDPYWHQLVPIGKATFSHNDTHELYLQVHTSDEAYTDEWDRELGIELSAPRGLRHYVHVKPCLLIPRIMLNVAVSDSVEVATQTPASIFGEPIGEVISSKVQGIERREIGNAQAWFYPSDNVLVLWECEVFRSFGSRSKDPATNNILAMAWEGFERVLLEIFTDTKRIVTPGWEPEYRTEQWQAFLYGCGYQPENGNPQAFVKRIN